MEGKSLARTEMSFPPHVYVQLSIQVQQPPGPALTLVSLPLSHHDRPPTEQTCIEHLLLTSLLRLRNTEMAFAVQSSAMAPYISQVLRGLHAFIKRVSFCFSFGEKMKVNLLLKSLLKGSTLFPMSFPRHKPGNFYSL